MTTETNDLAITLGNENEKNNNFPTNEQVITEMDEEQKATPIVNKRRKFEKKEEELPPDIVFLEDRSLHGWLNKKSKKEGYFSSWKRMFVTVEHLKLRYFKDQKQIN